MRLPVSGISDKIIKIQLADDDATCQLGADLAMACSQGGLIFLDGDLGAGKTTFARACIRQMTQDLELEVPSPTFSILQDYDFKNHPVINKIIHTDLYRINDGAEIEELGLNALENGTIALVEWPNNSDGALNHPDLLIEFETLNEGQENEGRIAKISGRDSWLSAVSRSIAIRKFLDTGWDKDVQRQPLMGDASTRSYEFVTNEETTRILMNAPRQPDGPIIKDGKPYSQIANLAEDISAFVGVDLILRELGLRVPELFHHDLDQGLLLLEYLGAGKIIDGARHPIRERYLTSASLLADFHQKNHSSSVKINEAVVYDIPDYNREAMLIEVDLLAKWYAPRFKGSKLSGEESGQFVSIWNALIDTLSTSEKKIALRDYHSPNIIWRDQEAGNQQAAVIDFQDAVMGPSAYDLASLAQDARIDISSELEIQLVDHYCSLRFGEADFNEMKFRQDYAIMSALRSTKILGIFVRLDERDNKPNYLEHLPRMQNYIMRSLQHPIMADYKAWYETVMIL